MGDLDLQLDDSAGGGTIPPPPPRQADCVTSLSAIPILDEPFVDSRENISQDSYSLNDKNTKKTISPEAKLQMEAQLYKLIVKTRLGDLKAKEDLLKKFDGLIRSVIRGNDELRGLAVEGFLEAIRVYNDRPSVGKKRASFATYATVLMGRFIHRASDSLSQKDAYKLGLIDDMAELMRHESGELPTPLEIAQRLGWSEEMVAILIAKVPKPIPLSLDHPLGGDEHSIPFDLLQDKPFERPDQQAISDINVSKVLGAMAPLRREIVKLRMYGYSIPDIAKFLNIPENTVKTNLHRAQNDFNSVFGGKK
jgi:DNA-directed RNA polymerase specialized sigma subunit